MQQHMTFSNLYKLLQQLVTNRDMYQNYYDLGLAFQVQLVKKGSPMHFNIEKNPLYSKKNKHLAKYEIVIHATFGGTTITDDSSSSSSQTTTTTMMLACKLPSALMEPLFGKSATDLRGLNKTNRAACQPIVEEGGRKVREKYFSKRTWKATLLPTVEQVFGKDNDSSSGTTTTFRLDSVSQPILLLEPIIELE
jgi:hypothetical protein